MHSELLKYYIAIELIPNVGSITAKKLIAYCGGVEAVFLEKKSTLSKILGIGNVLVESILANRDDALKIAEIEMNFIEKNRIKTFVYTEKDYPKRLLICDDSPVVFFSKGDVDFNCAKVLSIVGTRKATDYGTELCEKIIADLAVTHKPVIVSGLAYGIDVCAHKAALQNGLKTIAVMGTGLNIVYPSRHVNIANQISQQGAVITDFTSQSTFDRTNFLSRNRIIAGLADATIVVESGRKGGALVTADIAASYNRDVLTFPARVGDEYSAGCNWLIKTNKAALVENIKDIEYVLGWTSKNDEPKQLPLFDTLNEKEMLIINHLKKTDTDTIDNISHEIKIPMSQLSAMLLALEFGGYIKSLPGKSYSLKKI
ncbi:MAG: DNA-processing protein DprA [Prevotellaceae bacterium]|jgi:DNA processing protein|nr:DNA-processing protein DprA [Prevotellaceae bacterium]